MPLRHASDLLEGKTRNRVLGLTEGVMGRICRLMEVVAVDAIRTGKESISHESLNDEMAAHTLVSLSDRRRRRATA